MSEYIKRDDLLKILYDLSAVTTADVVEVVRGVWLNTTHGVMCSVCESIQVYGSRYYKYCPICGARMLEE